MEVVRNPGRLDVVRTEKDDDNLLSDIGAGIIGGLMYTFINKTSSKYQFKTYIWYETLFVPISWAIMEAILMYMHRFYDMGGLAYFALAIAIPMAIGFFLFIIVIEAIILWRMKWATLKKSILASIGINIMSAIVGYFLIAWIGPGEFLEMLENQLLKFLFVSWIFTIYIEGGLLVLLNRSNWQLSMRATVVINIASYIWNAIVISTIHHFFSLI